MVKGKVIVKYARKRENSRYEYQTFTSDHLAIALFPTSKFRSFELSFNSSGRD